MKNLLTRANLYKLLVVTLLILKTFTVNAQLDSCGANVPFFYVDLTGAPDSVWSSPNISRDDQCCNALSNENCISFELVLDSQVAGIQIDMIGADPAGSLYYDIDCQGNYPGGTIKCISGVGPHHITFCKPGSNKNIYIITSIPKPIFPLTDTVRIGCSKTLEVLGIEDTSINWNSIFPGNPGDYNNYLSCTDCVIPSYEPQAGAPAYVEYEICGYPIADECGYAFTVCDTVRVYNFDALQVNVSPNPATYCDLGVGSGVDLTATVIGGDGNYSYYWYDESNNLLGTDSTYKAQAQGTYTVEVSDGLNSTTCPSEFTTVSVTEGEIPLVDAGNNQKVCASNPTTLLNGSIQFATGGAWSGGNGTFSPDSTSLNVTYLPTTAEVNAGQVELILTSTGAGGGCPETADTMVITIPDSLMAVMNDTSVLCNGGTMDLSPQVTGGIMPYTYNWSTAESTISINVGEGYYNVKLEDSLGCKMMVEATVTAPSPVSVDMSSTDASTNGGSDGTATATPSGGSPGYTYSWSPSGQSNQTATGLSYGIHTVAVTDSNGCTIIASVVVNEPRCASFSASVAHDHLDCFEANDATAEVMASGGTTPYSYSWSNGDTTAITDSLAEGVYTVTVTDSNGCLEAQTIVVTQPTQITNVMSHTDATSIGGNDGSATANTFGGGGNYSYLWNTGDTSATVDSLFAGVYSVDITDDSGCVFVDSVKINEPPCDGFILNINKTDISCGGYNDGTATVLITDGKAPYTIVWSNGGDGMTIDSLSANNYTVTVTDALNCTTFGNVTITEPNALSLGLAPTDISCFGRTDGTINASISGGVFPYTYNWSNGKTSEDLAYLDNDSYTLTVTDNNGCSITESAIVNEPAKLEGTYITQNVLCNGGFDAAIDFSPIGGVMPYTFDWSNGETTEDLDSLEAGGYSIMLYDANNCKLDAPIVIGIAEPDSIKVDSFNVACPTPGSGVATVDIFAAGGAFDPYQISYDNGLTYQSAGTSTFNLPLDSTYSIIVKDSNNCTSHIPDTISINPQVMIDTVQFDPCYSTGATTATLTSSVSGGAAGLYSISYDNGNNFNNPGDYIENLTFNTAYVIVAKDSLGCLTLPDTVDLPDTLHIDASVISNFNGEDVSCYGLTDGSVLATTVGGTGATTYLWSNASTNDTLSNVGVGTYTVIATDVNNCKDTTDVTLTQPDSVNVNASIISNYNGEDISCYGYSDGLASATSSGGTGSFNFLWSNNTTNDTLFNVPAGTYDVIVTDVNGCVDSTSITITQPDSIGLVTNVLSNYNGEDVSCYGLSDGQASVTATNGTGIYTYLWSTNSNNDTLSNVGSGTYFVQVTDQNGCIDSAQVVISQPDSLNLSLSITSNFSGQNIRCNGEMNGAVASTLIGGTPGYNYVWSSGQFTANINSIGAGTYTLSVTDTNGCTTSEVITLSQPDKLIATTSILSDYNGVNISCYDSLDGYAMVDVIGGTLGYDYIWSNADNDDTLSAVGAGNYSVIVTDTNGCVDTADVLISQPDSITTSETLTNVSCDGGNDGAVDLTVFGGIPSYTYSWTGPGGYTASTQDISNIAAGTYLVTVTDTNGCVKSDINIIVDPTAISLDYNLTQVACYGDSTGSYDLIVSGGTPGYSYSWSSDNGFDFIDSTLQDQTGLVAGTYTVNVTDDNGCYTSLVGIINQPDILALETDYTDVSCYGLEDAAINVEIIGGVLPYNYSWSSGHTEVSIDSIGAGEYVFTMVDSNQCAIAKKFSITQPDSLTAEISSPMYSSGHHVSLYGETDGSIDLTVSGGTEEYDFIWSNNDVSEDLANVGAGEYSVVITDANGCEAQARIILTEPFELAMPTGYSPNDDGANDFFVVRGIEAYPDNVITVFNRWGNEVYERDNYQNEWNGLNNNGERLPDGTYFVILKINDGEIELTGYVDMRR